MMSLIWSTLAFAGAPPGPVLVSPEPVGAPALYTEEGGEGTLACEPFVEELLLLCYRLEHEGKRRYVTTADLAAWDMDPSELRTHAAAALTENPLKEIAIEGGGQYWQSAAPTGREATVLLHPEWLAVAGPSPVVGLPSRGVVVVWQPGDAELDTMVGVGIAQMHEQLPHPITPVAVRLQEGAWSRWGQAVKR